MRRFDASYLRDTRRGMWDDREALDDLDLPNRRLVLDVGCGTGELSAALRDETGPTTPVVGLDADDGLLSVARRGPESVDDGTDGGPFPVVRGDAHSLPLRDGAADLAACQALLINLPDPGRAVDELVRVSSDLVAAVEPDNAAVSVTSTVGREEELERRARAAYLKGVGTDVALGAVEDLFEDRGLTVVSTRRHDLVHVVEPPYGERDLRAARRKATGAGLMADRPTMLAGGLSPEEFDDLRSAWRAMGRRVVGAMERGDYRRREVVPFHVTVGRVGPR